MQTYCQEGDIARIVNSEMCPDRVGHIVRCVKLYFTDRGAAWFVDPQPYPFDGIYDFCLRPIANPGDDEVDVRDVRLGERAAA